MLQSPLRSENLKMVFKNTIPFLIAFLIALLLMFGVAQSFGQPSDSPGRGAALDLSSSRGNLEGSAPKPSAAYRRTLRTEAPSPADAYGSGMTASPTKSPKQMSASSTHSLHTNSFCPDCRSGSIDPSTLIPTAP